MKNKNKFSNRELSLLKEVLGLESRSATSGNFTDELEKKSAQIFGRKYCIAQNSGTSTMHSALLALGVSHGDEVISPAFTVIMNTAVTLHCGAIPVYVDVDPETYCICPNDLEKKITTKTKAIMIVSVYGQAPEYDQIIPIAKKYNIPIIEDNAETVLGYYKGNLVGTQGDFSSMSLEDSKHLSCGEGGLLLGDDENLMELSRKFAGHGFQTLRAENGRVRLDPSEWQHPSFKRHIQIGFNYRLTEFQSAIALAQLERVEELIHWRKRSGKKITQVLLDSKGLFEIQKTPNYIEHSFWCVGAKFNGSINDWENFRDKLFENCGERIFGAWRVPYLEPVMKGNFKRHLHEEFKNIDYDIGMCPNAEKIQSSMMVFKTKYRNDESLSNFTNGLKKTINHFS